MRNLIILGLTAGLSCSSAADDAYWSAAGGAGNFGKSKDIRMVSEVVHITLKHASMHVHATFNFQNAGAAETVTMAFPETMKDYKERRAGDAIAITSFKSTVDGKPVTVTRKEMPLKNLDEYARYSAVWLKQVPFEAKGKRQVVCDYEAEYSQGRDYFDSYYILRSGATWKGDIGDCLIHVDWSQLKGQGTPIFRAADAPIMGDKSIKAARQGEDWAEFHFKHIKPKFDLKMDWMNSFWNFRVNGKPAEVLPIGQSGESLVHGSGADPTLDFEGLPDLLGTVKEAKKGVDDFDIDNAPATDILLHGREMIFTPSGRVKLDGRYLKIRQAPGSKEENRVFVRDIVNALGGTYRYDSAADRADIRIRWKGSHKRG